MSPYLHLDPRSRPCAPIRLAPARTSQRLPTFRLGIASLLLLPVLALAVPDAPGTNPPALAGEHSGMEAVSTVDDPMLAPALRPAHIVGDWDEALRLVQERSTDARSAEAGVERAQGRWREALSALLPNAQVTAAGLTDLLHPETPPAAQGVASGTTGGAGGPTAPLGVATATVTLSVVDLSARMGVESAAAARRGAEATLRDTRRRLTQGLAHNLVAVVAAERVAELNRVGLRQALERAALTRRTAELGAATQLDVVRVQQDVAVARGTLVAGDEQLRRIREALALALGLDSEAGVPPGFALDSLVDQARAACPAAPLEQRPDLVAARENVASARAAQSQARRGYLPTLGLQSSVSAYTTDPGFARVPAWSVSAVVTLPLWEGGLREGLVRERAGVQTQAEADLEATRRDVTFEAARARRGVEVATQLVTAAAEARALAGRTDALTRRSFQIGRATSLELVQTASALRAADLALAAAEFDLTQARLDAVLTEALCNW